MKDERYKGSTFENNLNPQNTEGKDVAESIQRILIPKKDIWQNGDQVLVTSCSVVGLLSKIHSQSWEPADERDIGRPVLEGQIGRRTESELTRLRAEAKPMTVEELADYAGGSLREMYTLRFGGKPDDAFTEAYCLGFLACARLLGKVREDK